MENKKSEKKWNEFIEWISLRDGNFFRGVSDRENHLLIPSIGRDANYSLAKEVNLFEHFKLKANLLVPKTYNDFEWLVLAQHHGLPTRLLDWTSNPLVAVFFAVKGKETGRIYATAPSIRQIVNINDYQSPFEISDVSFLMPPVSTRRIELQKGLFSIHPIPNNPIMVNLDNGLVVIGKASKLNLYNEYYNIKLNEYDGNAYQYQEDYMQNVISKFKFTKNPIVFDIESVHKEYFNKRIRSLGIDEMLMGDIDGVASYLKYQQSKGNLHAICNPSIKFIKAEVQNVIEEKTISFLTANNIELYITSEYITYNNHINVIIDKIEPLRFNRLMVTGKINICYVPNLHNQDLFDNVSVMSYNDYVKYANVFTGISSHNTFIRASYVDVYFLAEIFYDSVKVDDRFIMNFTITSEGVNEDKRNYIIENHANIVRFYKSLTYEEHEIINSDDEDAIEKLIRKKRT